MIVSAGPVGGGGLAVYRALPCSKIYTIFLPMDNSSWTMQYCQKVGAASEAAVNLVQSASKSNAAPNRRTLRKRSDPAGEGFVAKGKQNRFMVLPR
jgi:hypothetical protein